MRPAHASPVRYTRPAPLLALAVQVVVICGRNRSLLERLQAKSYDSGLKVTACGFINNIHECVGRAGLCAVRGERHRWH